MIPGSPSPAAPPISCLGYTVRCSIIKAGCRAAPNPGKASLCRVPALTLSAPNCPQKIPMGGSAGEGKPGHPVFQTSKKTNRSPQKTNPEGRPRANDRHRQRRARPAKRARSPVACSLGSYCVRLTEKTAGKPRLSRLPGFRHQTGEHQPTGTPQPAKSAHPRSK